MFRKKEKENWCQIQFERDISIKDKNRRKSKCAGKSGMKIEM